MYMKPRWSMTVPAFYMNVVSRRACSYMQAPDRNFYAFMCMKGQTAAILTNGVVFSLHPGLRASQRLAAAEQEEPGSPKSGDDGDSEVGLKGVPSVSALDDDAQTAAYGMAGGLCPVPSWLHVRFSGKEGGGGGGGERRFGL